MKNIGYEDREKLDNLSTALGCGVIVVPVALLVACVGIGIAFGAAWGFVGASLVMLGSAIWLIASAKSAGRKIVRKYEEKGEGDDK